MAERNARGAAGVAPAAESGQEYWPTQTSRWLAEYELHRQSLTA